MNRSLMRDIRIPIALLDQRAEHEPMILWFAIETLFGIAPTVYAFDDLPQDLDHFDQNPFGKIVIKVK